MIFVPLFAPGYYKNFKCIADRCQHNCCIGWEIDIDAKTLEKYKSEPYIMQNVSLEGTPHFVLGQHDRCPFLQSDNLCEIIKTYGDAHLCQICNDHPRFRSFFDSRTEIGLGLTCEAAAKLILDHDFCLEQIGDSTEPTLQNEDEAEFFGYRDEILRQDVESFAYLLPDMTVAELSKVFKSLERRIVFTAEMPQHKSCCARIYKMTSSLCAVVI